MCNRKNIYCTFAAWGFMESCLVNSFFLIAIIFGSFKRSPSRSKTTYWHALKVLIAGTCFMSYLSMVLDSIRVLRRSTGIKLSNIDSVFTLSRRRKAGVFVRLAHSHLVVYAGLLALVLMTIAENYTISRNTNTSTIQDEKKKMSLEEKKTSWWMLVPSSLN